MLHCDIPFDKRLHLEMTEMSTEFTCFIQTNMLSNWHPYDVNANEFGAYFLKNLFYWYKHICIKDRCFHCHSLVLSYFFIFFFFFFFLFLYFKFSPILSQQQFKTGICLHICENTTIRTVMIYQICITIIIASCITMIELSWL